MNAAVLGGLSLGGEASRRFECSRAACTQEASWGIQWRNPKIHSEDRRKTWLACDEHLSMLRDFLEARSFPLTVVGVSELDG
ncbi:hypothetical protein [Leucobacter insecticola]|uniref:hypothetical protein n=1 Tax=Leucobacter insecticola TaxID=2714934 RepID=UPI0019818A55|nr:hypothetical protein [Leucobacter insecticola]